MTSPGHSEPLPQVVRPDRDITSPDPRRRTTAGRRSSARSVMRSHAMPSGEVHAADLARRRDPSCRPSRPRRRHRGRPTTSCIPPESGSSLVSMNSPTSSASVYGTCVHVRPSVDVQTAARAFAAGDGLRVLHRRAILAHDDEPAPGPGHGAEPDVVRCRRSASAPRSCRPARTRSSSRCPRAPSTRSPRPRGRRPRRRTCRARDRSSGRSAVESSASDAGTRSQLRPSTLVQTIASHRVSHPRPTATNPGPPAVTASMRPDRPIDDDGDRRLRPDGAQGRRAGTGLTGRRRWAR